MEIMRCEKCSKRLKEDMDIQYDHWSDIYFCSQNCASDFYAYYLRPVGNVRTHKKVVEPTLTVGDDGGLYKKPY
ncbi:hypothetical protein [Paenibacillus larvae]|uniref:hypothetical protein n=1 Tax=Paenibacillus larvae TaxID=1464 RepID=UPI00016957DC|nr:hypothetical protein [Paenibacillus larvae]ETK27380.1 hypothetical protein ERIC1_1c08250 [Paenibacillus larvae subsp. larvae DSM 25719]MDT2268170.1 hypothetical protein [Paenibacillus larvae]MDT2277895.1 hypothetical protein [Paenibacillus larvae]MDT2288945.1 hypothetical protein [Paenibacillus larvae]MDT2295544.1 hypothetical protein [Paenibacillus larvae]